MAKDVKKQHLRESEDVDSQIDQEINLFGEPEHVIYCLTESSIRSGCKDRVCKKAPTQKNDSKKDKK